jgi:hypothetical protein
MHAAAITYSALSDDTRFKMLLHSAYTVRSLILHDSHKSITSLKALTDRSL